MGNPDANDEGSIDDASSPEESSPSDHPATESGDSGGFGIRPLTELLARVRTIAERERVQTEHDAQVSSVDAFLRERAAENRDTGGSEGVHAAADYLVETQFQGDEFVVVADLLGASIDDVSAGVHPDRAELVVKRGDESVVRVALPWESTSPTRAWFNNGVLEIRFRRVT